MNGSSHAKVYNSSFFTENIFVGVAISIVPPAFFSFESMCIWFFNKYILILGIDPPFLLVPVLLQSVPVEAELDRDVSAVFRTVRIVRLLLVPVLRNLF